MVPLALRYVLFPELTLKVTKGKIFPLDVNEVLKVLFLYLLLNLGLLGLTKLKIYSKALKELTL